MMNNNNNLVSIGLPVYNGENFIEKTLKCLINQSYKNIEIIISDNASSDKTEEICRYYLKFDKRISYFRNKINKGASWNYNFVFHRSKGTFFKWAAHDDLISLLFIEECVKELIKDQSIPLCHSKVIEINKYDNPIRKYPSCVKLGNKDPIIRFYECVCKPHSQCAVFGVFRSSILGKTRLIEKYSSSDRSLLGEISLRGPIVEIPKYYFFKRSHDKQHFRIFKTKREKYIWYDPNKKSIFILPNWRLFYAHIISILRVPLNRRVKTFCLVMMLWWMRRNYKGLIKDLLFDS